MAEIRLLESMGNRGILARLAQIFLESSEALICVIEEARRSPDRERLCHALHDLKGISASLGASRFAGRCAALEAHARHGAIQDADGAALREDCARVQAAVRALLEPSDGRG